MNRRNEGHPLSMSLVAEGEEVRSGKRSCGLVLCQLGGLSQEHFLEEETEGWLLSSERKVRKRKHAEVTQCFLQFGSLENDGHTDIKGIPGQKLLWGEIQLFLNEFTLSFIFY